VPDVVFGCFCRRHHDGTHNGDGPGLFWSGLAVRWCMTDCECNRSGLALVATQPKLTELKSWLRTDINQILANKHGCASKEERDAAMRRPEGFQDGEVWLMAKLDDTNPARLLVKRSLQKLDAETLGAKHVHICGASAMGHMTKAQRMQLILDKLEANGTFKHQQVEWERQTQTGCNQPRVHDVCKTTLECFNFGFFGSHAHFGQECEIIDKKCCCGTSRQSEQNASWSRHMEMRSIS